MTTASRRSFSGGASAAHTGVAPDGTVSLYNQLGSANLILDIDGYFVAPPAP